jgi:hypothetical protein
VGGTGAHENTLMEVQEFLPIKNGGHPGMPAVCTEKMNQLFFGWQSLQVTGAFFSGLNSLL